MKTQERVLQRLPEHGGGTSKKDRLPWVVGALFRMVYDCLTPTVVALSVYAMTMELELSGGANPRTLLRIALLRMSLIIQEEKEERMEEFSRTVVFLYRMLGGVWSCYLNPAPRGGDGRACCTWRVVT